MTEHTPGPWTHALNASGSMLGVRGRWDAPSSTGIICYMTNPVPGNHEGKANARLIALAPELLAALKEYDEFSKANDDWRDGGDDVPGFVVKARAAIAKARGE